MQYWIGFLNLIRWKNLVIVIATQVLIWVCVLLPLQLYLNVPVFLNTIHFSLICLSTTLLAAAGYIINDYFDIRIDLRNRPEKVIIGKVIKQRWAMFWHSLFNVLGIGIALYLAYQLHNIALVSIQVATTILLWIYSTHLKRMYISGNVCVALLTGMSLFTLACYEPGIIPYWEFQAMVQVGDEKIINPVLTIGVYAFFAFMLTWIREVVKDMEDFKGDAEEGCVTMPIKLGLKKTTVFIYSLVALTLLPIVVVVYKLYSNHWILMPTYLMVFILMPLLVFARQLNKHHSTKHYEKMSKWLKLLMVLGVFTLVIYFLNIYA